MIPEDVIDQIREASDVAQVIGEYVRLKKRGRNFLGLCPFHQEKTPSFSVSPDKQIFHCFGCGKGGNIFTFLMEHEKMSFVEAVQHLAKRANITIREDAGADRRREKTEKLHYANTVALEYFRKTLKDSDKSRAVGKYLAERRRLTPEAVDYFQLGLAGDSWDGLLKYAAGRDLSGDDLVQAGLALLSDKTGNHFDRFRQRLMIPIFNISQKPIAFGGRTLKRGEPAKYVNSPETPLYVKGNVLYGLNFARDAIRDVGAAIVVEGYFDVISLWQAGIKNVVASSGTAFTAQQARLLARFAEDVYLFFDADSAGQTAALRSVDVLYDAGLEVRIVVPPPGEDPDSVAVAQGADGVNALLENSLDFITFRMRDLDVGSVGIIGKERLVKELGKLAERISDATRRALFQESAAAALNVPLDLLKNVATHSADTPEQSPPRPRGYNPDEYDFVSLLTCMPGSIDGILERVSPDDFDSKELSRLFAAVATQYQDRGAVDLNRLIDGQPDEDFISLVTAVAAREWEPDEVESQMRKALDAMMARKAKRIRARLGREMAEAEAAGDQEKADRLLREIKSFGLDAD